MARELKLKTSKGDIAYRDDIISQVALKTGYTEKQVANTFDFMFPQIQKYMQTPDVTAIRCDNLGTFYYRASYAKRTAEAYTQRSERLKFPKKILSIAKKATEKFELVHQHYTQVCNEHNRKLTSPHFAKSLISSQYFRQGKTLKYLEEQQNQQAW